MSKLLTAVMEDESILAEVDTKKLNACTQNLAAIGEALQAYENDNNEFPEWLSDLHPKYLRDANALKCPADEDNGIPILPHNTDPNLPVSYNYDAEPEYYHQWLKNERHIHNNANPIVRCNHHANIHSDSPLVESLHINLSFSNTIYLSGTFWYKNPTKMYGNLENAIKGYERALQLVPEDPDFFRLYPELVSLYVQAEEDKKIDNIIEKFKTVMKPDENIMRFRDYFTLVEMLRVANKHNEALQLCEHLQKTEQKNPFIKSLNREIAVIHEELGNSELAEMYYLKFDSKREMIGKPAPDFSATDMMGKPISLKDFRGKFVILDFWATWCGPCIGEMPNVIRTFNTYKEMGLDVIGISLDKDEEEPQEFLDKYQLPWRQIFDGSDGPLKKLYRIGGIPSLWLIDREGIVISNQIRGAAIKKLVGEIIV